MLPWLIASFIIAYNNTILGSAYEKILSNDASQATIGKMTRISPIAWIDMLLTGRYSFEGSNGKINLEAMVRILGIM